MTDSESWNAFDDEAARDRARLFKKLGLAGAALALLVATAMVFPEWFGFLGLDVLAKRDARDKVAAMLIDPDSARFRNLTVVSAPTGKDMVCGEVNGRNQMGGYAGFSRFIMAPSTNGAILEPSDPPSKDQRWGDEIDCDEAETSDERDVLCAKSKRTTAEYEAAEVFKRLVKLCPSA